MCSRPIWGILPFSGASLDFPVTRLRTPARPRRLGRLVHAGDGPPSRRSRRFSMSRSPRRLSARRAAVEVRERSLTNARQATAEGRRRKRPWAAPCCSRFLLSGQVIFSLAGGATPSHRPLRRLCAVASDRSSAPVTSARSLAPTLLHPPPLPAEPESCSVRTCRTSSPSCFGPTRTSTGSETSTRTSPTGTLTTTHDEYVAEPSSADAHVPIVLSPSGGSAFIFRRRSRTSPPQRSGHVRVHARFRRDARYRHGHAARGAADNRSPTPSRT